MSNVNAQNLFSLLLLVSLFQRIKCDWDYVTEEREFVSIPQLENNFGETLDKTVTTTAFTVDDYKFDDNELKKLFVRKFKFYENLEIHRNKIGLPQTMRPRRKSREVTTENANTTSFHGMECYTCLANSSSKTANNCYEGVS